MANEEKSDKTTDTAAKAAGIGASAFLYNIPAMLGFGAGGIAKGSVGAWMMSLGGGTTPYVVSVLQSVGAAGVGLTGGAVIAGAGIGTYYGYKHFFSNNNQTTTTP